MATFTDDDKVFAQTIDGVTYELFREGITGEASMIRVFDQDVVTEDGFDIGDATIYMIKFDDASKALAKFDETIRIAKQ